MSSGRVLGLAVSAEPDPRLPDATYELCIDDETFHIRTRQGRLQPAHGPAPAADATITTTKRTLAAIASGDLEIPNRRADRSIAVDGDSTHPQRLLGALRPSA
jgi:alkyl sulfatase BDS1-like metallo-beta-lactamase superfamily hydrolase